MSLYVGTNNRSDENVAFVFDDEELMIKIKERVKQKLHIKSEKEKKERHWWGPKYGYVATGEPEFSITNMYRTDFKIAWNDKKSIPLEKQILDIAQGFSRAFEESKIRSIEAEKQTKIRAIEEAERTDRERLAEIEIQRRKDLLELVTDYRTSTNIIDMVAAIEAKGSPCDELSAWLEWATGVTISIDPTQNTTDVTERFNRVAEEPSWKWKY